MYIWYMLSHKLGRVNFLIGRCTQIYRSDHAYSASIFVGVVRGAVTRGLRVTWSEPIERETANQIADCSSQIPAWSLAAFPSKAPSANC